MGDTTGQGADFDVETDEEQQRYRERLEGGPEAVEYTNADLEQLRRTWNGSDRLDCERCPSCGVDVAPGLRFCGTCGTTLFVDTTPDDLLSESGSNFARMSNTLGLIWRWILRGRTGLQKTEGRKAYIMFKRAQKLGFDNIFHRFMGERKFHDDQIIQHGWDEEGESAREADRVAMIPRLPNTIPWDERERRGYWRQVAENRPQSGSGSMHHGYIPPTHHTDSSVPGASPGDTGKGAKGKGKGKSGKRAHHEYERSRSSRDSWENRAGTGGHGAGKGDTTPPWWYSGKGSHWDSRWYW